MAASPTPARANLDRTPPAEQSRGSAHRTGAVWLTTRAKCRAPARSLMRPFALRAHERPTRPAHCNEPTGGRACATAKPRVPIGTAGDIDGWCRMRASALLILLLACGGSAAAQGFTFGSAGRDYPYPNEPQYQYPSTDGRGRIVNRCPRGQAPYQVQCRTIRWLPGSPRL